MKMSLQDMFAVEHSVLFTEFASKPVHTAYEWACRRLTELISSSLEQPNAYDSEVSSLRNYRKNAYDLYKGNLVEFYKKENPSVRQTKVEPLLIDLINTVA